MKKLKVILTLMALVCVTNIANAQADSTAKDTSKFIVITNDGGEFIGTIESDDGRELKLQTIDKGVVIIPKYAIKSITKANNDNLINGVYFFENPHSSRYFYTPSGYGIKKGEGYVQTIWGVYYQLQYGITDNFSIGASTTIIGSPLTFTPKYSYEIKPKLNIAVGAQVGTETYSLVNGRKPFLGIGYASLTKGSKENNLTFGVGYAFLRFDDQQEGGAAFSVAGITRLAKKISMMGEFWVIPNQEILFGGPGVRIMMKRENILDFGVWVMGDGNNYIPAPFLSYTWSL